VVVYTSQDEEYAEPIFKDFERQTGIQVRAVYDSEATKTVGLALRLLRENSHPQCDVFWNNEELRTRQLAAQNVFRETNGWVLLGWRSRRIAVNTNLLSIAKAPRLFSDATNALWHGKIALAYPLSGTTVTHFLVLREAWGDQRWRAWCRALAANKPFLVDGNSVVAKLVGGGQALLGFSDSDDIAAEQREGRPVAAVPLDAESLIVHNSAGIIRGAPHPAEAQKLLDYLKGSEVQEKLVRVHALESARPEVPEGTAQLRPDWEAVLRNLDAATAELKEIFLRNG
jgi:iron(III) transport system substrate-binding protein